MTFESSACPCQCPRCGWLGTLADTDSLVSDLKRTICPSCPLPTTVNILRQKGMDNLRLEFQQLLKPGYALHRSRESRLDRMHAIEQFFESIHQPIKHKKILTKDDEVRSLFKSKYPLIVNDKTRISVPDFLLDLLDRFFQELTDTGNAFYVKDVRWRAMRIFLSSAGTTSEQRAIYDKYITESLHLSRESDHQGSLK